MSNQLRVKHLMEVGQRERAAEEIMKQANELVVLAAKCGFLLTIETAPRKPLAMGNYGLKIGIRDTHKTYRSETK